jgi:hypothetical protein
MRTGLIALALLAAMSVIGGPADAASSPAVTIRSITPSIADRGALAELTGNGLGGPNVRIDVGGAPAHVVSATGSKATFRVPALAGPGRVVVRATNPGGRAGEIPLTVRFDGSTAAHLDEAAATRQTFGDAGGSIAVAGMELAIPAGAVPEGTTITATPLRALEGSPFAGAPVGLKLEPSGLVLLQPATLTLPKPAGAGTVVGFGFDGDGADFHLVPTSVSGDTVQLKVWHFSGAGAVSATVAELNAVFGYEPTPAHLQAEHLIAAALATEAGGGAPAGQAIFDALNQWQFRSVLRGLQVARDTERLDFFELAFGEWQAWSAYVQEYDSRFTPSQSQHLADVQRLINRPVATEGAAAIARRVLNLCIGPGVPRSALRDVLRLASAVNLAGLLIEQLGAQDGSGRNLPNGRSLPNACVDVQLTGIDHAAVLAHNRDNTITAHARVVFWTGSPTTTVALRYRLADITNGPPVPLASGTSATGTYEDTISPASLGSRELELTADLDSSGTDSVLRAIFDQLDFSVPVRERVELQARRPGDAAFTDTIGTVPAGGSVQLRIRLAGDDIAAIPVTFTHDGSGSLPATATTSAQGDVTVTYTSPTTVGTSELVTATVTDDAFITGDAIVITTRAPVTVTVTPSFGFASVGGTVQFTATVTGTTDHRVSWVAGGGTISATGLYTAGSNTGVFSVTAVSLADSGAVGTASVQVTGANVEGRYMGTVCTINDVGDESCATDFIVDYQCGRPSNIHPGTTCGWFAGQGLQQVPWNTPLCTVETDGTTAGGSFRGTITFCRFRPASTYSSLRIEGTIGNGRLEMRVYAPGFDGVERLWERNSLTKVP